MAAPRRLVVSDRSRVLTVEEVNAFNTSQWHLVTSRPFRHPDPGPIMRAFAALIQIVRRV